MSSGLPGAGKEDELDKVLHELQMCESSYLPVPCRNLACMLLLVVIIFVESLL